MVTETGTVVHHDPIILFRKLDSSLTSKKKIMLKKSACHVVKNEYKVQLEVVGTQDPGLAP